MMQLEPTGSRRESLEGRARPGRRLIKRGEGETSQVAVHSKLWLLNTVASLVGKHGSVVRSCRLEDPSFSDSLQERREVESISNVQFLDLYDSSFVQFFLQFVLLLGSSICGRHLCSS